ncbi:LuxR C-terminal-related transcriptional regulator [Kitasatospora sp. NPDC049258]|uniref:LuxR C-terminal-related transcriptional regulator n=1 Tax=Kitasatospora sp. NPDC049258 TaxID=3155394 RepID=UPI003432E9A6
MQIDRDGARHVRYDRSHRGLPVVGGDLVVHRAADGRITGSDLAHRGKLVLPRVTPKLTRAEAARTAVGSARSVRGATAPAESDVELVVYAADAAPVQPHILGLLREVATNREIAAALHLSVKAVEANLTRLYRRHQVRGRAELVRTLGLAR